MKPTEILGREKTPDGEELALTRRDNIYLLSIGGMELMTSRAHGSEDALARLGCEALGGKRSPRMLVGGLGFGFTLRAALDHLPPDARVVVCEVFASLLEWNRTVLGDLAGHPLRDPRVQAVRSDLNDYLDRGERFDVILLDVDNGPEAFTLRSNNRLYSPAGLVRLRESLNPGGVLAVWSAHPSPEFERLLRRAGFDARSEHVTARFGRCGKGRKDTIFVARPLKAKGEKG
ncbi:MAG TPA: hypothetical protein VG477_14800 [Thermoanaerobaculia bacterium]|nr:hypothetical protein [Thermoanaerobaculia bacterium]